MNSLIEKFLPKNSFLSQLVGIAAAVVVLIGAYKTIKNEFNNSISRTKEEVDEKVSEKQQNLEYMSVKLDALSYKMVNLELTQSYLVMKINEIENKNSYKVPPYIISGMSEGGIAGLPESAELAAPPP